MLVPETELAKEGIHVKGFEDEVYWITHGGQKELNEKIASITIEKEKDINYIKTVFKKYYKELVKNPIKKFVTNFDKQNPIPIKDI